MNRGAGAWRRGQQGRDHPAAAGAGAQRGRSAAAVLLLTHLLQSPDRVWSPRVGGPVLPQAHGEWSPWLTAGFTDEGRGEEAPLDEMDLGGEGKWHKTDWASFSQLRVGRVVGVGRADCPSNARASTA